MPQARGSCCAINLIRRCLQEFVIPPEPGPFSPTTACRPRGKLPTPLRGAADGPFQMAVIAAEDPRRCPNLIARP